MSDINITIQATPLIAIALSTGIPGPTGASYLTRTGTTLAPTIAGDDISIGTGKLKDSNVTTGIRLGDALNTSLHSDNKTIIGSMNETYDALSYLSAGVCGTPAVLTDNNNGTATISSFTALLYPTANFMGTIRSFTIPSITLSFTDGIEEYIAVKYNAGTPTMYKETVGTNINNSDIIPIFVVWRIGNKIHSLGFDSLGCGLSNKLESEAYHTSFYQRSTDGGLIISELTSPASRTIALTGALVYTGAYGQTVSPFNSSVNNMYFAHHVGGVWAYTVNSVYNNTQYDNGSDLVSLTGTQWGVFWFYRTVGDDVEMFYTAGSTHYPNKNAAEAELPRTDLSPMLKKHCVLVGRAIIQRNAISGNMSSSFGVTFTGYSTIAHNDTESIEGGDSVAPHYYHSNQPINTTDSVTFNGVTTPSVTTTGDLVINTGANKTLVLNTVVYDDSMTPAASFRTGGTALTFAQFQGNIWMYRLDVGDIFYVQVQLPHTYKENTIIYPHLHLAVNSAIGATGYNVEVTTEQSWGNIGSAFGVPSVINTGLVGSFQNAPQYKHSILNLAPMVPAAGQGGISSFVIFKIERITASVQPLSPATSLFILGLDLHFEVDTCGSRQITSK